MANGNKSGCVIVAILTVFGGGVLLVVSFIGLFRVRSHDSGMTKAEFADTVDPELAGMVIFPEGKLPSLPTAAMDEVTREQYLAYMMNGNMTALAKDEFRKVAADAPVRWLLKTEEIFEQEEQLQGRFNLPWEMQWTNLSQGGSESVKCLFAADNRAMLLTLSRGDWVTVSGHLSLDGGGEGTIINARVGDDLPAERP